jgi:2-C-methyl-D-erythritol 4-phosphate cytidylyltransferase / 2-C-methyl-D-erythritol 2,4-cyclodiphosphate synthase
VSHAGAVRADVIVVAAGRSSRMGGTDKLATEVMGRPLLAWTLRAVAEARSVERIVVAGAADRVAAIAAADWLPDKVVDVVTGGARRQESVHAGFAAFDRLLSDERGVVLVHDAARPLVDPSLIDAVAAATAEHGAAIPVVPVVETLKRIDGDLVGTTVERDGIGAAQTPQGVRRDILRAAWARYAADGPRTFTDEAALLEACDRPVRVVAGDATNLKVTRPGDLASVVAMLSRGGSRRSGIGHDSHPFGPGEPLLLGGVEIAGAPRLHGHSDGDVVLHAVADALLGAAGLGDLGRLFPADARTPRGIAGATLIEEVGRRLAEHGWRVAGVDLTVIAARPRLEGSLDQMRASIGSMLGLDPGAVNVKASTGNLDGPEGAGRSVSALALATIEAIEP